MSDIFSLNQLLLQKRTLKQLWLQTGDQAQAWAPSNIALIKYWGKDPLLQQVPQNSSVSLTLNHLRSTTQIRVLRGMFSAQPTPDLHTPHVLCLQNQIVQDEKLNAFLQHILSPFAGDCVLEITSHNNFPMACGIASSASGYAALVLALADLLQLNTFFTQQQKFLWVHHWARIGSGSASRSVDACHPQNGPQFVTWEYDRATQQHAWESLPVHPCFKDLQHGVLVLDDKPKAVSSSKGHAHAHQLPLQTLRVATVPQRLQAVKHALAVGDFEALALHTETDGFMMHAVMHSSTPCLNYLNHEVADVLAAFIAFRGQTGLAGFWTLDAGPNIHLLYLPQAALLIDQFVLQIQKQLGRKMDFLHSS